jgi:hypothetical protein
MRLALQHSILVSVWHMLSGNTDDRKQRTGADATSVRARTAFGSAA